MNRTITDGVHKTVLADNGEFYWVSFYELMGGRWVLLSRERWSCELVAEEYGC